MKKIWIMAVAMTVGVAFTANAQNWGWAGVRGAGEEAYWTVGANWSNGDIGDYPGQEATERQLGGAFNSVTLHLIVDEVVPYQVPGFQNLGNGFTGGVPADFLLTIATGGDLSLRQPRVGRDGGWGHIDVNGGTFTATAQTFLASETGIAGSSAWLTIRGGSTATVENISLARIEDQTAIVTIEDGTFHATGNVTIFDPSSFEDRQHITLNHVDAIFRWNGDRVGSMNTWIDNGGLRAGTGMELVEGGPVYDAGLGYTELRVIPEPGTIALLGLAGLAMLIRRRFVK